MPDLIEPIYASAEITVEEAEILNRYGFPSPVDGDLTAHMGKRDA